MRTFTYRQIPVKQVFTVETKANGKSVADHAQNSDSSHLQAIPALKTPKSNKPPHVKAQVIAKRYAENKQIAEIARETGISRPTVYNILAEANSTELDKKIECGRVACIDLIPKAAQAIEKAFDRGDGALAVRMFEGLGILGQDAKGSTAAMKGNIHLQTAIQVLLPPAQLHNNAAAASTNPSSETAQVIDVQEVKS